MPTSTTQIRTIWLVYVDTLPFPRRAMWLVHVDTQPKAERLTFSSSRHQPERRMAWFTQTLAAFFTLWLNTVFFFWCCFTSTVTVPTLRDGQTQNTLWAIIMLFFPSKPQDKTTTGPFHKDGKTTTLTAPFSVDLWSNLLNWLLNVAKTRPRALSFGVSHSVSVASCTKPDCVTPVSQSLRALHW